MNKELLLNECDLEDLTLEKYQEVSQQLSKIDREYVEDQLEEFPSFYSYFYGLLVKCKSMLDSTSLLREEYISGLKNTLRESGKKITVAAGDDLVNVDETAKTLHKSVKDLEVSYAYMKGICNTLEHKKDMLVQLSVNKRQETKLYQ